MPAGVHQSLHSVGDVMKEIPAVPQLQPSGLHIPLLIEIVPAGLSVPCKFRPYVLGIASVISYKPPAVFIQSPLASENQRRGINRVSGVGSHLRGKAASRSAAARRTGGRRVGIRSSGLVRVGIRRNRRLLGVRVRRDRRLFLVRIRHRRLLRLCSRLLRLFLLLRRRIQDNDRLRRVIRRGKFRVSCRSTIFVTDGGHVAFIRRHNLLLDLQIQLFPVLAGKSHALMNPVGIIRISRTMVKVKSLFIPAKRQSTVRNRQSVIIIISSAYQCIRHISAGIDRYGAAFNMELSAV